MNLDREQIIGLLESGGDAMHALFARAARVRDAAAGPGVYLRGLVEYSNVCRRNCLYCGIRRDADCARYTMSRDEVLACARTALDGGFGSVVIQGGEDRSRARARGIGETVRAINEMSGGDLGITLSLGEQSAATYRYWRACGATRYLLRIETSNRALYRAIHPHSAAYDLDRRLQALADLREAGYQVGTGVMTGLPGQTTGDLADDLVLMHDLDIDMCGMGPYIVSRGTPMERRAGELRSPQWRLDMTLRMIAVLRLMMPDINIAAATALDAIDPGGRRRAVDAGANVVMPNLTPTPMRDAYRLYDRKPANPDAGVDPALIRFGVPGDPRHFHARQGKSK